MAKRKVKFPDHKELLSRYAKGHSFNQSIDLYDKVTVNENFYIGNQWEGVQANGLPTPVYNIFKQVINFQVSTITSENMALQASPLASSSRFTMRQLGKICEIVTQQLAAVMERNNIVTQNREFLRNAAVTADGCIHAYFDPTIENGQDVKGEIVTELIDNLRVIFGNPNCRQVQRQPWIMLVRRELVEDVKDRAADLKDAGLCSMDDIEAIQPDSDKFNNYFDSQTDDKVTVLTYYTHNRETGTIWCIECCESGIIRDAYDTEYKLYPLIWINWDYIRDCYHGQAMVTGLLSNQKFINKMFALVSISLLTTAFPKIVYDKNRVRKWDSGVGTAIGVNGNVADVAKVIEGAPMSPQIAQFIEMAFDKTRSLLGASDVAMGDSRPDNTSAIIALQRAANTPMELVKQNDYQCIEDLARIFIDIMSVRYGTRMVEMTMDLDNPGEQPLGMQLQAQKFLQPFDFSILRDIQINIKLDVGASSYWSEMANVQTLENLLMNGHINVVQFLERLPSGYLVKKQELIDELKGQMMPPSLSPGTGMGTGMSTETTSSEDMEINPGSGNAALQRALNKEGA